MDSMIAAAARALAAGDLLGALKRVALRDDAPALALRGIAMAQLGDLARAKALLKDAARAFAPRETVAKARCIVAEAEIALVSRDLAWPPRELAAARATLEAHGDRLNAAHARLLEVRRMLLIGDLDDAARSLRELDAEPLPPALRASYEMALAGIAIRRLHTRTACDALERAAQAAHDAGIPALAAEVEGMNHVLRIPAGRLISRGGARPLLLGEVEALFASGSLVVDACRYAVREAQTVVPLATRPVLFALARVLAERWPGDASREELVSRAFRGKEADESHRARLRVEMGRLRNELRAFADISATKEGFVLAPKGDREVVVLAPPVEEEEGAVLALLADGEAWSSSALAIALGASARTVQRSLEALAQAGKVHAFGRGPARRWTIPSLPGFPSTLLLPGALPES
ncbi:helix-turn-helix domain-containing protein [Massilia endophytica]|uniref:helix-turn-helix domain-containing protein n=1 Tax=Massilia endophytica TaxID=2899220 RepID=UPI001E4FC3EA|nr:helix-turn-helix domain-containing protein [Massilia endophytica]UGQ48730.1 helix-turn-helix domain-containing protein [Massilia endophytica]